MSRQALLTCLGLMILSATVRGDERPEYARVRYQEIAQLVLHRRIHAGDWSRAR